ncbi:S-adenosyl-L-methionine-dependent methyltransferase [Xylaria flabelliformis]|nr:S-adenosyl-L-methionine-dependent methyltransferase [Xylaria flabelliformis]
MGKAKTSKRGNTSSGPYERPSKSNSAANNVFKFTKDLGQHILRNPGIAQAIVEKAVLKPTDVVLEVGPGTGNLTVQILNRARKVIAVEMDPRMAAEVTKRVQGKPEHKRLEVVLGDVIKQEPLPDFDVCISNTPYQISSPLVFKLLRLPKPPRTCILMFQREFAMRLTARPGDSLYCRLSVNAQFWAKISHVLKVGRANFRPPPQVDSSVVRIEPKTGSERPNISFEEFDGLLRICFNRRNKVLRSLFLSNKEVLKMLETNYRLYCATNDIPIDDGLVDDAGEDEEMEVDEDEKDAAMDVDGDDDLPSFFGAAKNPDEGTLTSKRGSLKKTRVAVLVKEKVRKVLEETELAESRSAKLHENDFLRLLAAFNAEGIHFS